MNADASWEKAVVINAKKKNLPCDWCKEYSRWSYYIIGEDKVCDECADPVKNLIHSLKENGPEQDGDTWWKYER